MKIKIDNLATGELSELDVSMADMGRLSKERADDMLTVKDLKLAELSERES